MNELHLFSGAGGGILGGLLLGHTPVCAVEIEPYCRKVLLQRQRDGILPWFPIWDDVRTFDGSPWRGIADIVCGGFPCQDISSAGHGAGLDGERSGLWAEFARVIREVQPPFAFVENSPMLTLRGIERVIGDLAAMGYDAEWGTLSACGCGAPHTRERLWILGYSVQRGCSSKSIQQNGAILRERAETFAGISLRTLDNIGRDWWKIEPKLGRVVDGVAGAMDRIAAIGNGQVPAVAAKAWHVLCQRGRVAAEHYGNRPEHRLTAAVCNTAGH